MAESPSPGSGFGDVVKKAGSFVEGKWKKLPRGGKVGLGVAGGINAGAMLLPLLGQYAQGVKNDLNIGSHGVFGPSKEEEDLQFAARLQRVELARRSREEKLARLTAQNMARIQQFAPHLAAKLMAGRALPNQGVLIGGTPRTDVLEAVARDMASGRYGGIGEREHVARQDLMGQQAMLGPE